MKNRGLVSIIIMVLLCSMSLLSVISYADTTEFSDVNGHWAERYILSLMEKGAITGMPDGLFHPDDTVTIPQFVKIIMSGEYGEIEPINGDWASGYMQKAFDIGIIDLGDMENTSAITRHEAARLIHNSLLNIYDEVDESDTSIVNNFLDYPSSCKFCLGDFHGIVGQCYVKGIISGKPGPVFDGESSLTRAEACTIIMKMVEPQLRVPPV